MPERPKKTATRPSSPTFAEQCIGKTPSSGSRSFISVKIDFLISPAYSVPPISTSAREGCRKTKVPLRGVPSSLASASTAGACSTSAAGSKSSSSSSAGSMKRVLAKSACHGLYVTTRTASR